MNPVYWIGLFSLGIASVAALITWCFYPIVHKQLAKRKASAALPVGKATSQTVDEITGKTLASTAKIPEKISSKTEKTVKFPLRKGDKTVVRQPSLANRLQEGLSRTRQQIWGSLEQLFSSSEALEQHEQIFNAFFEALIGADVGVATADNLITSIKAQLKSSQTLTIEQVKTTCREHALKMLRKVPTPLSTLERTPHNPHVVLMVGVNGVGKTTTTGKLAAQCKARGQKVILGAADTFRAAAVEQLRIWADRVGVPCIQPQHDKADPSSVAYETIQMAKKMGAQVCIIDTAGRLHNRQDLMNQLSKLNRVMGKNCPGAPHEVLLVVDATTGQNALQQAKIFQQIVPLTGLVLTKLDGTAKGGVVLAITSTLSLPVRYVGVGEALEDLQPFDAGGFIDALFS